MTAEEFRIDEQILRWDLEMWHQYVHSGLNNEISNHSRKDQRTYQRKFCSTFSRHRALKANNPEHAL